MISIVVVTFHSEEDLPGFLASVKTVEAHTNETIELLIHDNTEHNIGMSKAMNRMLERASGDPVIIANPDLKFDETILDLVRIVRRTGYGAVPEIEGNRVDKRFPSTTRYIFFFSRIGALLSRFHLNWIGRDFEYTPESCFIEQPGMSFTVLPKSMIQKLSEEGFFFDPRFPVYANDVDVALRARKYGFRFVRVSKCRISHPRDSKWTRNIERRTMLLYSNYGIIGLMKKWKMKPNLLRLSMFAGCIITRILFPKLFQQDLLIFRCSLR